MEWYLALAAKSVVVAGGTLLLLKLMHRRSASDRSWIAHLGLAALLLLPAATFVLPALDVAGPSFLTAQAAEPVVSPALAADPAPEVAPVAASFPQPVAAAAQSWAVGIDWTYAGYAVPAALLLLLTVIAVGRLVALKSRAQVLVDAHWLSALARAQRRMGFKNGTALLTSNELRSPVSWGLMRPVIVLNDDAAEARDDAEAIIAHELAHVARLDWAKLLIARIAVALFWFNPLVWLLSREAHQLREEAADDAVLGSDIDDTDYARLLVGVARHECNGLLLGAHGVAPSRNSLSRRVRRVLDRALTRAPGGWRWTSAAGFFAAGMAVPVAALNFVPTTPIAPALAGPASSGGKSAAAPAPAAMAAASPKAVAPLAASAVAVAHPHADDGDMDFDFDFDVDVDGEIEQAGREVRAAGQEIAAAVASARAATRARVMAVAHPSPGSAGSAVALDLSHIDRPVSAVSVKRGGSVVIRYGRVPKVRTISGNQRGLEVSYADNSLSVDCRGECGNSVIEVTTPRLEALSVQSGGSITVGAGFPVQNDLALATSRGGTIDARQLRARNVAAATKGGGTIFAFAEDELAASTNGGGTIRHWGNGAVVSSVRGGGQIEPGGG